MRTVLPGPCPVCQTEIEFLYQTENIPYFSDIVIISALCGECGFRYRDTQVLGESEPARWELTIRGPEDFDIRVVRSTRGSVVVPELGARIDPGPACEGFVSNVEGIISRIEGVVDGMIACGEVEETDVAAGFKEKIRMLRAGEFPVTLIIEDPAGNSLIVSDRAKKESFVPDTGTC